MQITKNKKSFCTKDASGSTQNHLFHSIGSSFLAQYVDYEPTGLGPFVSKFIYAHF